jgi:hypothetical protein
LDGKAAHEVHATIRILINGDGAFLNPE